jgi:integrase
MVRKPLHRQLMDLLRSHIALAFAFSLYTGMRLDELETLIWGRIDFTRGAATVITKGRGKKLKTRTVWLSQKAIRILNTLTETRRDQPVIFDLTNRRKHWEKAREGIGRTDVTWHDLRGMTATWSRQYAGADMRLIQATLGHSDAKVTERYARVIDREIVTMLDRLPDIAPQMGEQKRLS